MANQSPTQFNLNEQELKDQAKAAAQSVGGVLQSAAQAAVDTAVAGASSEGTQAAFKALSDGLEGFADNLAVALGGPVVGLVAEPVIHTLANALGTLFQKFGQEIPGDLAALIKKI